MSSNEDKAVWNEQEQLQVRVEIAEVKARYCRFLDCRQWDQFARVFTSDGCLQFGPSLENGAVTGRENIARLLQKQLKDAVTTHRVHPAEFRFQDNGEVMALWAMDDRVANPGYVLEGAGYYEERYQKINGQWFIRHMRLHRTRVDFTPASWFRPSGVGMRLVLLLQKTGVLKQLAPSASKTLSQAMATGISEGLFA